MKKTLIEINAVPYGSTGGIARGIGQAAKSAGFEVYTWYSWSKNLPKSNDDQVWVGSFLNRFCHLAFSRMLEFDGRFSFFDTRELIKKIDNVKPQCVHLHILHSGCLNLSLLFRYLKRMNIKVIWTLHDCWSFTGGCPHYTAIQCFGWKTGCNDCPVMAHKPLKKRAVKEMWNLKKELFSGVANMEIVTPSKWLANEAKDSFLACYPISVINNGIDLNIFRPTESDFRQNHHIEEKTIILGVALGWSIKKGLDVFIELSKRLDDSYQILLVGTDDSIDKQLPSNIISIHRTQNQRELAEIYTASDLFVNPTREDNYPTVNMESLACGTPVLTFRTGGSPEIIDANTGSVVDCNDLGTLMREIVRISRDRPFTRETCLEKAKSFDMRKTYNHYVDLFMRN